MNPIIRNFWSIFRHFRLAMTLNVLGMAIAFAAFMVIMMQWHYDVTFDDATPHGDCIFRVESNNQMVGATPLTSRPYSEWMLASSSHIEAGALMWCNEMPLFLTMRDEASGVKTFKEQCFPVTPSITRVFDFDMVEGSSDALDVEKQILIPQSMARKFFGDESAIGKRVEGRGLEYILGDSILYVGGVYHDFPRNSTLQNQIYVSMGDYSKHNWYNLNCAFFIRLDDPSSASAIMPDFEQYCKQMNLNPDDLYYRYSNIRPLKDLHWVQGLTFDAVPKANRQTSYLLFTIAWVIIFIAAINFTNFSTALAPIRMRSINTQRVLGSSVGSLRWLLTSEAIFVSFVAFLLSILFFYMAKEYGLAQLVTADLSLTKHWGLVLATALVSIALGAVAGLYPAYYMTSFQPAMALKGSFGLSPTGRRLRVILMGFQYVASFALIIGSLFMLLQNRYTRTTSLGYDREHLLTVDLSPKAKASRPVVMNQLKGLAGVEDVAYIHQPLSGGDDFLNWGREVHGEMVMFDCIPSSANILNTLNIPLIDGRDFRESDVQQPEGGYAIINQLLAEQYNVKVGDKMSELEVVGIIPDIKYASFRKAVSPMAFVTGASDFLIGQCEYACIRLKAGTDLFQARENIRQTLQSLDPSYAFDLRFSEQVLEETYHSELNLTTLIALFSFLAVFISIVGVFGLVVFDSEYKRKEIGIRKVMGATTGEILVMFNKVYLRMMSVCFILAAPLAWYGVHRWLENFSYKTPMYWWVYLAALAVVGLITVATVTYQNWKAANANPVESLKTE